MTGLTKKQQRQLERFAEVYEREILRPEDEVHALALLISQIGRRKQSNLWGQAVAVDYLVKLYGSRRKVAEALGISYEQVRQRHNILGLPGDIKMMFV